MKTITTILLSLLALCASAASAPRSTATAPSLSLPAFGAKGDGVTLCTDAFRQAMQALKKQGGGRLTVPAGVWLTGPIEFESGVELRVERGALVLFTTDYDAYPEVTVVYEGNTTRKKMSPLWAYEKHDVTISGPGTFDAQGEAWRPSKRGKFTDSQWAALTAGRGVQVKGVWYPDAKADSLAGTPQRPDTRRTNSRPTLLEFTRCQRVTLREATFSNSPAWNLHPLMCDDVLIDGITVRNPWYAQNGDGLDLESCRRAVIRNSTFDVGDDAICLKSGKDAEGRSWRRPCEDVLVEGCTVLHGHGGFVIGSEMSSGVRNVTVRNCLFNGTDVGLRLKSTRGRGGIVENIVIDSIQMVNIAGEAFIFNLYYAANPSTGSKAAVVSEETPCFRNITVTNVTCAGAGRAIFFNGLPEMPLQNITLRDSRFRSTLGADLRYASGITFSNVLIDNATGPRLTKTDVTAFTEK